MDTLKKNKEFKRVYNNGKSYATSNLVLYWYSTNKKSNRYGFSISKKIGNAVVRNKLRRRLKEIIRILEVENFKEGYDLIFIARKPVVNLDFYKLKRDVIRLFKKSGIWSKKK